MWIKIVAIRVKVFQKHYLSLNLPNISNNNGKQSATATTTTTMYNPESVLENEMHKILWGFEIQTDHLISARRINRVIVNKQREPIWF